MPEGLYFSEQILYNGCDSSAEARQRLDERSPDVYKYCPHCGAKMDGEI